MHNPEQQRTEVNDHYMVLTTTALQIYLNYQDWTENPEFPFLQIPLAAIEKVVTTSAHCPNLDLNMHSHENQTFVQEEMCILKLKDDFLNVFLLEQYSNYGLAEDFALAILNDQYKQNQNQISMLDHFKALQKQILHESSIKPNSELPRSHHMTVTDESFKDVVANPILKKYLLNKLIVFSVADQNNKVQLINAFNKIISIGDNWWNPNYYVDENYDLMNRSF